MVLSGPANFDRRTVMCKTWASDPSMTTRWKTVFLLGHAVGDSVQNEYLKAEKIMYRDIIRGSQNEQYRNLTLKTQIIIIIIIKYLYSANILKVQKRFTEVTLKILKTLLKKKIAQMGLEWAFLVFTQGG